jgi:hypothetical protein
MWGDWCHRLLQLDGRPTTTSTAAGYAAAEAAAEAAAAAVAVSIIDSAGRSTAAPAGFSGEPAAPDSAVAVAAQAGPAPGADCDMQPSHSRQGIGRRGRPPHGR